MPLFDESICPLTAKNQEIVRRAKIPSENNGYLDRLEALWTTYSPYAPPRFQRNFLSDAGKHHSLIWEMLLANKLLEQGCQLVPSKSDDAPDLCVMHRGQKIWIECTLPEKGEKSLPDSVPEPIIDGEFHEVDIDKSVLRCTNALQTKKAQHLRWLEKKICRPEDGFIVGINGANLKLSIRNQSLPGILRPLYGMGDQYFSISPEPPQSGYLQKQSIQKASGQEISTTFFIQEENKHIDGVLFSTDWIGHFANGPQYSFVENIHAQHKLSVVCEHFCQTYDYVAGTIRIKNTPA